MLCPRHMADFQYSDLPDIDLTQVERTLRVNLVGPILAVKYASRPMLEAGSGAIICTASIASIRADVTPVEYSASKVRAERRRKKKRKKKKERLKEGWRHQIGFRVTEWGDNTFSPFCFLLFFFFFFF